MQEGRVGRGKRPLLVLVTGPPGTGKSSVAEAIATLVAAPVLSHDWAMSGLRPYREIQTVLDGMEPSGHRAVGWSILRAIARAQLRSGRSVILDGVARSDEIARCEGTAQSEGGRPVLIATRCADRDVHRSRVEGRERQIPNWYELDWQHVERALDAWVEPETADLSLDSAVPWTDNVARIAAYFASMEGDD